MKKNSIAEPATTLITLGVLKGYISNPLLFLVASKISFKKYKKTIKFDLPNDFISSMGFIAHLYNRLIKKVGKEKAYEIMRACLITSGLALQQANFRNVESGRTFDNLKKYQQQNNREGTTKLNTMEIIEESERRYEFKVTRCMFHELFTHLNVPELTTIICSIDNAIFNTYLPEKLIFHRNGLNKTIPEGNKYCEFVIENKMLN